MKRHSCGSLQPGAKICFPIGTLRVALWLNLLSTFSSQLSTLFAQGTAFTYQGRLNDGASAANGSYEFIFSLFSVPSGGSAAAGPLVQNATAVSNGLFVATLDFGAGVFNGTAWWLEIAVHTNAIGAFTTLSPRQPLTPAPYAIYAENANAAGLSTGTVPASALGNAWKIGGNAGTSPGAGNFLGTTDDQPLELRVATFPMLRLEPIGLNVLGGLAPSIGAASLARRWRGASPSASAGFISWWAAARATSRAPAMRRLPEASRTMLRVLARLWEAAASTARLCRATRPAALPLR
jgi:hypothetical protein